MRGATHPLPNTPSWRGAQLKKHRNSFTFTFTRWGKWSDSHPGRFTHGGTAVGTHWIEGWVCPRAGLDTVANRKIPFSSMRKCKINQLHIAMTDQQQHMKKRAVQNYSSEHVHIYRRVHEFKYDDFYQKI
jgi:hypothetical protein